MKKILLIVLCLSIILISLSISYYFVIFLPQKERANEIELKKIQQQTQNIKRSIDNMPNPDSYSTSDFSQQLEDVRNSIIQNQKDERANESYCVSNGGRYQGGGTCVYY